MKNNYPWIKCPNCNGEGKLPYYLNLKTTKPISKLCSVCRGMKIISEVTSLPPDELNFLISQ